MPLTGYSRSEGKELDVGQVLSLLSNRNGHSDLQENIEISAESRAFIRRDIECPCCFVTGAEIVQPGVSKTSRKIIRQGYFRFATPGHRPECDYFKNDSSSYVPENLIAFGSERSNITREIRALVCKGIQSGLFSQKSIRDMREWFFHMKMGASLDVKLDPRLPGWLYNLRITAVFYGNSDQVPLSATIVKLPGFDWTSAAQKILTKRHIHALEKSFQQKLWLDGSLVTRVEVLAKRYNGENVFDPTSLRSEYDQALQLGQFITSNYAPLKPRTKKSSDKLEVCVLAFSALLLFVGDWDLGRAANLFASISSLPDDFDPDLGNVMGLNPFHDFRAWDMLKKLQDSGLTVPDEPSPKIEFEQIESDLREQFRS
ncbi:MAG: hypothetical protein GYB30_05645 [Gammaproteobacteria bacterium]|nr:hypothetical protein [Gammaproteobacteria bacterium]